MILNFQNAMLPTIVTCGPDLWKWLLVHIPVLHYSPLQKFESIMRYLQLRCTLDSSSQLSLYSASQALRYTL